MLANTLFSHKVKDKLRLNEQSPEISKILSDVLNNEVVADSLTRKIGNLLGHALEDIHTSHLASLGLDVEPHPYGQKFSPDHIIRHNGDVWWVEHKNCSEDPYKKSGLQNFVRYAHYKHSDRKGDQSIPKEIRLRFSDQDVLTDAARRQEPFRPDRAILAVSLYPATHKLDDWRYIRWSQLPTETICDQEVHNQHPYPPFDTVLDGRNIWTDNIFDILEGNKNEI